VSRRLFATTSLTEGLNVKLAVRITPRRVVGTLPWSRLFAALGAVEEDHVAETSLEEIGLFWEDEGDSWGRSCATGDRAKRTSAPTRGDGAKGSSAPCSRRPRSGTPSPPTTVVGRSRSGASPTTTSAFASCASAATPAPWGVNACGGAISALRSRPSPLPPATRSVRTLGALDAFVGGYDDGANALYASVFRDGFDDYEPWLKRW
jgi:hypothetical protein